MGMPMLLIPGESLTVQAIPNAPAPGGIVIRISNTVAAAQMGLDADQAHALIDNIRTALLECRKIVPPTLAEVAKIGNGRR